MSTTKPATSGAGPEPADSGFVAPATDLPVPGSGPGSERVAGSEPATYLFCGDSVAGLASTPGLAVTGEFPDRVPAGGDGIFAGSVTVTSTGPTIAGVTTPAADVYLTRSGTVVTNALAQEAIGRPVAISPGQDLRLAASGATLACAPDGSSGAALEPGHYEAYALVTVVADDGTMHVVTGGPWPVELG